MTGAGHGSDRLLRRLAAPGALLVREPSPRGGYAVFANGDRRGRATARADAETVRRLRSDGALRESGARADAFELTEEGRARLRRGDSDRPGEAFRAQHQLEGVRAVAEPDGTIAERRANLAESPLAWLYRRTGPNGEPFLSAREFAAGERLRADHERAAATQRLTSDWTAPPVQRGGRGASAIHMNLSEAALYARERVRAAMNAVGPGLDGVLEAACLRHCGLDRVEREAGWPRRSAKVVLKLALARLADHYGAVDR